MVKNIALRPLLVAKAGIHNLSHGLHRRSLLGAHYT